MRSVATDRILLFNNKKLRNSLRNVIGVTFVSVVAHHFAVEQVIWQAVHHDIRKSCSVDRDRCSAVLRNPALLASVSRVALRSP
jgi:hypothetical protein